MDKVKEYYNSEYVSQSALKLLIGRPLDFVERPVVDSDSVLLGSFVDKLLTDDNPRYSVCRSIAPPKVKQIFNFMFDNEDIRFKELRDIENYILDACKVFNFFPYYKDPTRVGKVREHEHYWRAMQEANGRLVLSEEMYNTGIRVAESIRQTKYFADLKDHCTYQYPVFFEIEGEKCKALIDVLYFNDDDKHITVADIKTTSSSLKDFDNSINKYRYDIQAAFYVDAVRDKFKDYSVSFEFIVQNTNDVFNPLCIEVDEAFLDRGRNGAFGYKGYLQLLDDLKWYREHGFQNHRDLSTVGKITCTNGKIHFL